MKSSFLVSFIPYKRKKTCPERLLFGFLHCMGGVFFHCVKCNWPLCIISRLSRGKEDCMEGLLDGCILGYVMIVGVGSERKGNAMMTEL